MTKRRRKNYISRSYLSQKRAANATQVWRTFLQRLYRDRLTMLERSIVNAFGLTLWWCGRGLVGFMPGGLCCHRHAVYCRPGLWRVALTGQAATRDGYHAVVDDFGNLVQVP